jgi:hypothetical protein
MLIKILYKSNDKINNKKINKKINCEKIASELPAFMLYALASVSGGSTIHEALLKLRSDKYLLEPLKEFTNASKIYSSFVKIYSNHIIALEKFSSIVCPNVLSRLFKDYITLYMAKGRPKETLVQLVREVNMIFKEYLESKISKILSLIEFIIATISAIIISIFISSFISININLITLSTIIISFAILSLLKILRIEIIDTYIKYSRRDLVLIVSDIMLISLLPLTNIFNLIMKIIFISIVLIIKIIGLVKLYKLINDIGLLHRIANLLSEVSAFSSRNIIVKRLQMLGEQGKTLAYTLLKGRTPMIRRDNSSSYLAVMLARIVAIAGRSGGESLTAIRMSAELLELVYSSMRRLFSRFITADLIIAGVVLVVRWALTVVTSMLRSSVVAGSYAVIPLPDAKTLSLFSLLLSLLGLIFSYVITYIMIRRPWLNIAAPIIGFSVVLS